MAGPFDFLHVKRRTAGSSNELSFDVLDAARDDLDGQKQRAVKRPVGPKASQGSYHGVAGTSTLSANAEVECRKRARRTHSVRVGIIAALVVMALGAVGIYAGYAYFQDKADFSDEYVQLIDEFVKTDETLVQIDAIMAGPLSSSAADRTRLKQQMPALTGQLQQTKTKADYLYADAVTDGDRVALDQAMNAADARLAMIDAAKEAFAMADDAQAQITSVTGAWDEVLAANQAAIEAAAEANVAETEEATEAVREKTEAARQQLEGALASLESVSSVYPAIRFADQKAYIEKKIEALEYAVQTSDALLAGERSLAMTANTSYNAAEREAAELAESLSEPVTDQVLDLFQAKIGASLQAYSLARESAIDSDSTIRSYLAS